MNKDRRLFPSLKRPLYGMIIPLLVFLFLSALLVLSASDSTSPWFSTAPVFEPEKADQAIFTIMGKHWVLDGKLPYVSLFDHKGPVIFLLNGLGYALTGNVHGITLLQIAAVLAYCLIAYSTLRIRHSKPFAYAGVILSLILLRIVYGGGNTVEEFGLPFHAAGMMGLYKWSNQKEAEHDPRWAFIYGISISFFILNRASDALCIGAGCLIIFIVLLKAKAWKNILFNLLAGTLGVVLPLLPFAAYFAHFNALDALWYGTIGYNLEYTSDQFSFWLAQTDPKMLIEMLIYCVPIWACMGIGILTAILRQPRKTALYLTLSICAIAFLLKSRFYDHYVINYVPLAILAACELNFHQLRQKSAVLSGCAALAAAALILPSSILCLRMYANIQGAYKWNYVSQEKPYDVLMRAIPEEDYDSVVLYNCLASIYLKYDICPAHVYFAHQDWQGSQSEKLMGMIEDEFASNKARWVMTNGGVSEEIRAVLTEHYELVMENESYQLHRLLN